MYQEFETCETRGDLLGEMIHVGSMLGARLYEPPLLVLTSQCRMGKFHSKSLNRSGVPTVFVLSDRGC